MYCASVPRHEIAWLEKVCRARHRRSLRQGRVFAVFVTAYCSACTVVMPSAAAQTSIPELPLALEFALNSAGYAISHDWSSDSGRVAIVFLQVPPNRVFRDLWWGR